MNKDRIDRIKKEASYIIETENTIRQTAEYFRVSKSTVHKDLQECLKFISPSLKEKVDKILKNHLNTRHIKGGNATKEKYAKKDEENENNRICYKHM